MNIKKIWQSYDFRNNKVLNAKCDEPTDPEHITNKKYVDDITTYDTPKAFKYKTPFKFDWLTNVYNLTYKKLFDDLLFPRVNPVYTNPVYTKIESAIFSKTQNIDGKGLLVNGVRVSGKVVILHAPNDRNATTTGSLTVTFNSDPPLTFRSNSTDNNRSIFMVDFVYKIGCKIVFSLEFNPCTIMRQDTYGDNYRPAEFNVPFTLEQDISSEFSDMFVSESSIFVRSKLNDTPASYINNRRYYTSNIISDKFTITTNLNVKKDAWCYYDVLMPLSMFNNYEFWLACIQDVVGVGIIEHKIEIEKRNLVDMLAVDGDRDKIVKIFIDDIPYIVCNLNLGYFDAEHIMRIMLNRVFINY